jgi:hypothetical protein
VFGLFGVAKTTGSPAGDAEAAGMTVTVSRMVLPWRRARFSGASRSPHRPGLGSGMSGRGACASAAALPARVACPGGDPGLPGVAPSVPRRASPVAARVLALRRGWPAVRQGAAASGVTPVEAECASSLPGVGGGPSV